MNEDLQNLDQIADQFLENEQKYKRALRGLLDWQRDRKDHQIALPAKMGTSKSYLMSVSLGWIASNVYFARDLPIFEDHRQKDNDKITINDTTIVYLQQREPDYRRQLPMTVYLATRKHHKFPPLLLVAYQDWVYDKNSDKWGPNARALEPSLQIEPLDSKFHLVDLDVTNTSYFALDGQHRLMAIKGLKDLLDGRLNAKRKDGSIAGKSITREEIKKHHDESGFDSDEFQEMLNNEIIGVEVIPAVQTDETYEEAVARLRNVFVDVNENAKRLEKGELSMLDENDGFRIVARTLMTKHQLFKGKNELRVETKSNQISEKSEDYTTLNTIVNIARGYLGQKPEFADWEYPILGLKGVGLTRPEDKGIDNGLIKLRDYFTALEILPSHHRMIQGASVGELRSENDGNILFRPIAQVALARAVESLQREKNFSLHDLMKKLAEHEKAGDLRLTSKEAPWFGVLCETVTRKIRRQKFYEELCERMFIYLLGGGIKDEKDREMLRADFFEARKDAGESGESKAYDMEGTLVKYDQFILPHPWQ